MKFSYQEFYTGMGGVTQSTKTAVSLNGLRELGFDDKAIEDIIRLNGYSGAIGQGRYCEIYPLV